MKSRFPKFVKIIDEEGNEQDEWYEILSIRGKYAVMSGGRKISVDRIIGEDEMVESKKKDAKKEKKLEKFDKSAYSDVGVLFKSKNTSEHSGGKIEKYYVVSKDFRQWRSFQTYNGSLGKKGALPSLKDIANKTLNGNEDAIKEYMTKKEYEIV